MASSLSLTSERRPPRYKGPRNPATARPAKPSVCTLGALRRPVLIRGGCLECEGSAPACAGGACTAVPVRGCIAGAAGEAGDGIELTPGGRAARRGCAPVSGCNRRLRWVEPPEGRAGRADRGPAVLGKSGARGAVLAPERDLRASPSFREAVASGLRHVYLLLRGPRLRGQMR